VPFFYSAVAALFKVEAHSMGHRAEYVDLLFISANGSFAVHNFFIGARFS